jgi:sec-independent protein translocase protein TatA
MITPLLTPTHVAVVLVVLLLVFGPRRLPQTGRALGQTLREFKAATADEDNAEAQTGPQPSPR